MRHGCSRRSRGGHAESRRRCRSRGVRLVDGRVVRSPSVVPPGEAQKLVAAVTELPVSPVCAVNAAVVGVLTEPHGEPGRHHEGGERAGESGRGPHDEASVRQEKPKVVDFPDAAGSSLDGEAEPEAAGLLALRGLPRRPARGVAGVRGGEVGQGAAEQCAGGQEAGAAVRRPGRVVPDRDGQVEVGGQVAAGRRRVELHRLDVDGAGVGDRDAPVDGHARGQGLVAEQGGARRAVGELHLRVGQLGLGLLGRFGRDLARDGRGGGNGLGDPGAAGARHLRSAQRCRSGRSSRGPRSARRRRPAIRRRPAGRPA